MWKNVSNLWENINKVDTNNCVYNTSEPQNDDFILNTESPRDKTPDECPIELWPHQNAMLYRIRDIENTGFLSKTNTFSDRFMDKTEVINPEVILGVMNDPPGSGKTFVIITQILTDNKNEGASIIIVPQNIYAQWRKAIEIIFKNQLNTCKFISMYADIIDIYGKPQLVNSFKVVLLQDNFAESYLKTLNDKSISVCRVIIDEIDIMDKYVCSAVKSKYVWLMSASYTNQKMLGPYHIGDHNKVVCKCDPAFVKKSINLPEPLTFKISCDDNHIAIFEDIFDKKQIKAINAGDLNLIKRLMNASGQVNLLNINETIKKYSEYLFKKSEQLEEVEKEIDKYNNLVEKDKKEYNLLVDKLNLLKTYRTKSELINKRLETLPDMSKLNCKEKYLEEDFPNEMLESKKSKWLIFNDNVNVLIKYQEYLISKGIKTMMLDGGNQRLIEKTINEYKEGEVQVLLLNSMIEGAGMNLENTTHLLFMHKTEEKFIEQVVGRAQRFGRTEPLNIIMLFYKNE